MSRRQRLWLLVPLAAAAAGCGLKGPLTLPSRSDEVVIRGPGQTTTEPAATAPATAPAPSPARPADERPPPPPLPGDHSGAASGG